ncbi:MAG: DNA (cytosine-5-)-methyltransferase [Firmicutes bacterium]|nr:DNA (cytosine-5-)-methyltransferase [Bacillota bacterium]
MLTHFSLCTGIGGIDLAAESAGFKTIGQSEIDPYACKVLAKNFKGVPNYGDIRTITNTRLDINPEQITVLSAGFPCQPYSLAGKGLGDGDKRDLWGEVARIIGELEPRWFVGENVPGLLSRGNSKYFRRVLADLTKMGYTISWGIWGARDVGAHHKRNRLFIIARKIPDASSLGRLDMQSQINTTDTRINAQCYPLRLRADVSDPCCKRETKEKSKLQHNITVGRSRWQTEPNVGRVADGIPAQMDRLRCLGNAVVPQQIYPIFKAIATIQGVAED